MLKINLIRRPPPDPWGVAALVAFYLLAFVFAAYVIWAEVEGQHQFQAHREQMMAAGYHEVCIPYEVEEVRIFPKPIHKEKVKRYNCHWER